MPSQVLPEALSGLGLQDLPSEIIIQEVAPVLQGSLGHLLSLTGCSGQSHDNYLPDSEAVSPCGDDFKLVFQCT